MPLDSGNVIYATCRRAGFSARSFVDMADRLADLPRGALVRLGAEALGSDNAKPLLLTRLRDGALTGLHS